MKFPLFDNIFLSLKLFYDRYNTDEIGHLGSWNYWLKLVLFFLSFGENSLDNADDGF